MGTILSFITAILPFVLKMIGWYLNKKQVDAEMLESWYSFLEVVDQKGIAKVKNLLASQDALETLKERVRKRRENEGNDVVDNGN